MLHNECNRSIEKLEVTLTDKSQSQMCNDPSKYINSTEFKYLNLTFKFSFRTVLSLFMDNTVCVRVFVI